MKTHYLRISTALAAFAVHGASLAFIDERTPEPEPMQAQPLMMSDASQALFEQSNTGPIQADPNLIGTFDEAIWKAPYPGPFGAMPIADAVIAQVVPIRGAVKLDGDAQLLSRKVSLVQGQSRYETLLQMAKQAGLSIDLSQGNEVRILPARVGASAQTVASEQIRVTESAVTTDSQGNPVPVPGTEVEVQVEQVTPQAQEAIVPDPTWVIDRGVMLSAGMRKWFEEQGWQLVWRAKVDYQIVAPVRITDDFLSAVDKMLDAYKNADRPLIGYAHEAQRVIVVTEPGLKNASVERRPIAVTAPEGAAQVNEFDGE